MRRLRWLRRRGEKFSRQGVDAGTLGCRADDFDLEPFFECSLRIDFEGAGGDEIEPAARWHGEALHIVKSGQDADVERRDDFAYACVAQFQCNGPGVFVDQQVWDGSDTEGFEYVLPGRRHSSHLVVDCLPFAAVADLIGATGEYRAAS